MPSRRHAGRRPAPVVAANLAADRLPVGTPTLPTGSSQHNSLSVGPQSGASSSSSARPSTSRHKARSPSPPTVSHDETVQIMSLADIKLDRQRKRNEAAEASLSATAPPMEKRQVSRNKNKWKPFDYASDAAGGISVTETRVNTYSRASSLSRPISSLSHRTEDSTFSDASGFQLFTGGRRGRRHPIDMRNYGSEKQQTTVEAAFDKREIYEVFGKELPSPEYLEQNAGFKDGQVQFLQHPNGDVSAQQWSASRYEWVNLGQFSNIRKKVEGQLASDRLKGEMAYHTLHQNTLQYFRTIAKQREAAVMGLPFGPKEIEAALPVPATNHADKEAPDLKLEGSERPSSGTTSFDMKQQVILENDASKNTSSPPAHRDARAAGTTQTAPQQPPRSPLPPNVPKEPMALRWEVTGSYGGVGPTPMPADPFYPPGGSAQTAYPTPCQNTASNYQPGGQTTYGFHNTSQTPYRMPSGYQFPPVAVPNPTHQSPGAQKYFADRAAIADRMQSQWMQVYGSQAQKGPNYGQHMPPYYRTPIPDIKSASTFANDPYEAAIERNIITPHPKSISSVERSAMRHTLYKLGETARERNLSQANIRTVLHDPFQSPSAADQQDLSAPKTQASAQDAELPCLSENLSGKNRLTQSSPLPPIRGLRKDILQQSSPDTQWTKRPFEHSTPLLSKSSTSKVGSRAVAGHGVATQGTYTGGESTDVKRSYEDHIQDWWMNGTTFARQEDMFRAIMAAHATDSKLNSPPAHLTPIGPPSRNAGRASASDSINETTTRLLIPLWENLASYVDGPKQRDYWCPWGAVPEWCIDRSPKGNKSFFEADWGNPPQRVGRDPRYSDWSGKGRKSLASYGDVGVVGGWKGVDRRFAHAGGS